MSEQEAQIAARETIINIRKLAALDLVFHGSRFILIEFAAGVFLCGGAGAFALIGFARDAAHPLFTLIIGLVLSWIGLNYIPLLLYAINIVRRGSARQEVAFELAHKEFYGLKYTLQSLILILPLIVPVLTLVQEAPGSWSLNALR